MEEEKNKIKNICKAIIKEKSHFIKIFYKIKRKIRNIDLNNDDAIIDLINFFSSINFNKLNEYCWFGNFPKDEYIFYHYLNKYLKINEELVNKKINMKRKRLLLFISFSTDEEIYNKNFKDIFKISRKELINNLLFYFTYHSYNINHLEYIEYYEIVNFYELLIKLLEEMNFYNLTFQGNFFFNFKDIIYNIIFNNKYNDLYKSIFLSVLQDFLFDLLDSINYILFLPLTFILNNKYNLFLILDINKLNIKLELQITKYSYYKIKYNYENENIEIIEKNY